METENFQYCVKLNRDKLISFDGYDFSITFFKCSKCKETYIHNDKFHQFCPLCGIKYDEYLDASV